jgi:hypothetical protein
MSKKYDLEVSYPLAKYNWGMLDKTIEQVSHRNVVGGGTGFGYRDIHFSFKTKKGRSNTKARIEALKIVGLQIHEYDN